MRTSSWKQGVNTQFGLWLRVSSPTYRHKVRQGLTPDMSFPNHPHSEGTQRYLGMDRSSKDDQKAQTSFSEGSGDSTGTVASKKGTYLGREDFAGHFPSREDSDKMRTGSYPDFLGVHRGGVMKEASMQEGSRSSNGGISEHYPKGDPVSQSQEKALNDTTTSELRGILESGKSTLKRGIMGEKNTWQKALLGRVTRMGFSQSLRCTA